MNTDVPEAPVSYNVMFYLCMINEACLVSSEIVDQQQLADGKDRRQSPLLKRNGNLDTPLLYRAVKTTTSSPDPWAKFIWKNNAPPRVQFFGCLLSQCKANLARKGIVEKHQRMSSSAAPQRESSGKRFRSQLIGTEAARDHGT